MKYRKRSLKKIGKKTNREVYLLRRAELMVKGTDNDILKILKQSIV